MTSRTMAASASASGAVAPSPAHDRYVQSAVAAELHVTTSGISLTPGAPFAEGNRVVVLVAGWSTERATAARVSDSAGSTYGRLHSLRSSDGTEMSIWSAPAVHGGDAPPCVTVAPSDAVYALGATVIEFAGLRMLRDASVPNRATSATGTTGRVGGIVSAGHTPRVIADGVALGVYVDSGFGGHVLGAPDWAERENSSPSSALTMLVQDRAVRRGDVVQSVVTTGSDTVWLMGTYVFPAARG